MGKVKAGGVLWDVIYVEETPFWFAGRVCPVLSLNRYRADILTDCDKGTRHSLCYFYNSLF
jgi:hypothetical protein